MNLTDLKEHLLVQDRHNTLLKINTIYNRDHVTAQVVYENGAVPERTKVRSYTAKAVAKWKPASKTLINKSDDAWGLTQA